MDLGAGTAREGGCYCPGVGSSAGPAGGWAAAAPCAQVPGVGLHAFILSPTFSGVFFESASHFYHLTPSESFPFLLFKNAKLAGVSFMFRRNEQ